jgi:hypothetical protein
MTQRDWAQTDVSGQPRLLLGERKPSKKVEVHRVELHHELLGDLRAIAQTAVAELGRREAKPYSPFAAKTSDDYFDVDLSDIPNWHDKRRREDDPEAYEMASILAMVAQCDSHPPMTPDQLRRANPTLYAIVFEDTTGYVGFIRNVSPRRILKPGLKYLQYGDTLKKIDPPDLAIDDVIDFVIAADRCAVFAPTAFTTLFGDVGVAFQQVRANVATMSDALKNVLPLAGESTAALQNRCSRRVNDAKRLHHIVTERKMALKSLTKKEIQELVRKRGLRDSIKQSKLNLTDDNVSDFLDLIEGRLFNDDVTGEERRADAYSPRKLARSPQSR